MSGRLDAVWSGYNSIDPNAINRFKDQKATTPFGYSDMSAVLDKMLSTQTDSLTRNAGNRVQRGQKDMTSRLASQGITGGSVMNNQINKSGQDIYDGLDSLLERLNTDRMGKETGLMQMQNENTFRNTQAAQNVDFQNILNALRKNDSMASFETNRRQMDLQEDQQPGFLEDLMSGLGDIASIAAIPTTGGASFLGKDIFKSIFG